MPEPSPAQQPLVVVVLTFNCEAIIAETLAQACRLCTQPLVVDSYSSDRTVEIAVGMGCKVVQRTFVNYAEQRNWAISEVAAQARWQLHLDADEVLDDPAVRDIQSTAALVAPEHRAYMLRRVDYFMGRRLRHSGLNPWHLRLFMSGHCVCEERLYDQHFVADTPAGKLRGSMHDRNAVSLSDWTARHNRWSDLEAAEIALGQAQSGRVLPGRLSGDPRERTRWLKHLYYRLPGGLRALGYFGYRYVLRLGFLDGKEGFYFAVLQAFWFRLLVDAKAHERSQALTSVPATDLPEDAGRKAKPGRSAA